MPAAPRFATRATQPATASHRGWWRCQLRRITTSPVRKTGSGGCCVDGSRDQVAVPRARIPATEGIHLQSGFFSVLSMIRSIGGTEGGSTIATLDRSHFSVVRSGHLPRFDLLSDSARGLVMESPQSGSSAGVGVISAITWIRRNLGCCRRSRLITSIRSHRDTPAGNVETTIAS